MDTLALDQRVASAMKVGAPLDQMRDVAGKKAFDALLSWEPSAHERGHRDALLRYIAHLTILRVAAPAAENLRKALCDTVAHARLEEDEELSFRSAFARLFTARSKIEVDALLGVLAELGPGVAAARSNHADVIREAKNRFGEPLAALDLVDRAAAAALGEELLFRTNDLARHVATDTHPLCADQLFARGADGFPAHTTTFAADVFAAHFDLPISLPPTPQVLGATSFARALAAFGMALRASAPPPFPFAMRCAPHDALGHLLGATFGAVLLLPSFHRHVFRLGADRAKKNVRELTASVLLSLRIDAARRRPRDMHEQTAFELFGHPLPEPFLRAWPSVRDDEDERTTASACTLAVLDDLRDRFDEDWFRNPRALAELHARASEPPSKMEIPKGSAERLARRFEAVLA